MYLPRTLDQHVPSLSQQAPVLLVVGARQVGKTTLLRHAEPTRTFVTLDDPLALQLARDDPALFLQRFPPPVLIDEIQYAPQLLPHVKMAVDARQRSGDFWLSGSQQFHLMRGIAESLAGRVVIVELLGLSRRERLGHGAEAPPFLPDAATFLAGSPLPPVQLHDLFADIWRGSYPAAAVRPELDHDLFYASYVQTYLQRDVRDLARVGDEAAFIRFLRATAARTGQLLNMADLARDADIAPNTAKSWLSILQTSGVVLLLEAWHSNLTKRLVKAPKLHFIDTGLCAWLTGWSSAETLAAGAMAGPMLETWVVTEIVKSWRHNAKSIQFHHVRDKEQREVDLLLVRDGVAHPVEVKLSAGPTKHDVRHFAALADGGLRVGMGAVVCLVQTAMPLTAEAWAVPAGSI